MADQSTLEPISLESYKTLSQSVPEIHHSDQGVQYLSKASLLQCHNIEIGSPSSLGEAESSSVVTHKYAYEGQEYAQVSWLCKLLGISTGDLRRKFNYHQDLMIRQFNKKFIRVDYIPWWLVNLHGNLNLSEDALERVEQALDRLGIPVPAL